MADTTLVQQASIDWANYGDEWRAKPEPAAPVVLSYWERPDNVAATYDAIKANPNVDWASLGIDTNFVFDTYEYMKAANGGKSYMDWKPLDLDDPFVELLRTAPEPVKDAQWNGVYKPDYLKDNPNWWEAEPEKPTLPTGNDLANLTGWQRTMAFIMSSGALQGAMNALPGIIIGGVAGGPVGALVGLGLGAALGVAGDPENREAAQKKMLNMGMSQEAIDLVYKAVDVPLAALNWASEKAEQVVGTAWQYGEAALPGLQYQLTGDPELYDEYIQSQADVKAIVDNLPEVWEASRLTYEAFSNTAPGSVISDIVPGVEFLLDTLTTGQSDVKFAHVGEVLRIDGTPVKLDVAGAATLEAARNELIAGADPQKTLEKYQTIYGFSGQWLDLWGQTVLDPLNLIPAVGRGAIDTVAKVIDDPILRAAVDQAETVKGGAFDVKRAYKELLRQADIPVDEMSWLQRSVAGIADDGTYKELSLATTGGSTKERGVRAIIEKPVNWLRDVKELTPTAKVEMSRKLRETNLKDIIATGTFDDALASVEALQDMTPGKAVTGAKIAGSAEMYTVQRSIVPAKPEVQAIKSRWQMTSKSRDLFNRIASLVGEEPHKIISELHNGGMAEAQAIHSRLLKAISEADPNHPILRDPSFEPGRLLQHAEVFKDNKWAINGDWAKAELYNRVMNKATEFEIAAYGVKPDSTLFKAGQTLKSIQSILLLGWNPAYAANNIINNEVTVRATGVGGFLGMTKDRFGRLTSDIGGGRYEVDVHGMIGEQKNVKGSYASLGEAMEMGGLEAAAEFTRMQEQAKLSDVQGKGLDKKIQGALRKVPKPASAVSSAAESVQSDAAIRNGFGKAWSKTWSDAELRKVLTDNGADPALARLLKSAETGADIDRILGGQVEPRATSYVDDVARATGHDPVMLNSMFEQLGITEKLDGYIKSGLDPLAAEQAVLQDLNVIRKENLAERRKVMAEQAAVVMRGEGFAAGVDTLQDMMWSHDEFWTRSFLNNEAAFNEARKLEPGDRNSYLRQHFKNQEDAWRTEFELQAATWEGFLREAGFTDPASIDQLSLPAKMFVGEIVGNRNQWAEFYAERQRRMKKFFELSKDADPIYSSQLWAETQAEIGNLYESYAALELESIKRQGLAFMEMWREQMGGVGIEGVAYWWKNTYETAQRRQALMKDMRAWERGEMPQLPEVRDVLMAYSPKDKHQAWQPFLEKVYLPAIGEMTQANLAGTRAISEAANGMRLPTEMREALEWFGENFVVNPEDQAIAAAKATEVKLGRDVDTWLSELEQNAEAAEISQRERLFAMVNDAREQAGLDTYARFEDIPVDEVNVALNEQAVMAAAEGQPQAGLTTQRYLEPLQIGDTQVMGAAYVDGKFVAYIPARFEGKVFNTDSGPGRFLGIDPEGNWVYRLESGEVKTLTDGSLDAPVVGPYIPGTLKTEGAVQPDLASLFTEGFDTFVTPALHEMAVQMKSGKPIDPGMVAAGVTPGLADQLKAKMRNDKRAAMRFATMQRDFAMLDYSRRTNMDNVLELAFPYQFWFSRSLTNWSLRFADRPDMLAKFARLANFTDEELDDRYKIIPSRMKQRIRIPVPWLNSIAPWAGGEVYVDPWGKLFPPREFVRPIENWLYGQSRVQRKAEQIMYDWIDEGNVDAEEAKAAMESMSGPLWDKALALANQEEGADIVDFMSLLTSPSLAISLVTRGPERVGPLPLSRLIQGLAAATGIEGLTKLDLEAKWRKDAGLSEFGEFGDYLVDRQLANLAADGEFTADEVTIAMIEKEGPAYEAALERVRMEMALRQPGMAAILAGRNALRGDGNILDILGSSLISLFPGGLLPEGELKQRGLYEEYKQAQAAKAAGDKNAVNQFFDDHPEYKARMALYAEPEERLKNFMVSTVWDKYGDLPDPMKKAVQQEFGDDFTELFLNNETRDYDAIPLDMLVEWSQMLGSEYTPTGYDPTTPMEFEFEDAARLYQQQKDTMFAGIDEIQSAYWDLPDDKRSTFMSQHPELSAYWAFRDTFLADNPGLIPYFIGEDNSLYGVDPETQAAVYRFRAERTRLFGADIFTVQGQYYDLPKRSAERRAFLQGHPELKQYWNWLDYVKEQYPDAAQYLSGSKSKSTLGKDYTDKYGSPTNISSFEPEAQSALLSYFTRGTKLGSGTLAYLRMEWKNSNSQLAFNDWLQSLGAYFGK